MSKNQNIADIFYEIAAYLKMEDEAFRSYAYEKAASTIETLKQDIGEIYKKGGIKALEALPRIGKNISSKIEEYLKTGKIETHQRFKKKIPINLGEITSVEGIGPKKAKVLYEKLKIKDLKTLEKAAKSHKIASLFGFDEKANRNILQGIAFLKRSKGRFLLSEILPEIEEILDKLKKLKEVEQVGVAGSLRRMKETVGDADILVATKNPEKIMDFFVSLPNVAKVWAKGNTKSSARMEQGFDVDLRVVANKSYGAALQYFTGSKEHNIHLRKIAISRGLKLNEYGLFKGDKRVAGKTEQEIYKYLKMACPAPEMREDQEEIEAALRSAQGKPNGLPKLVELKDIKGDLHCHCDWDAGKNTILEMARMAMGLGYQYIGISSHTKFLRLEHGLNEKQLSQQRKEIDKLNKKLKNFKILQGAETNILNDGSIDIKDEALKKLDYVIAGVHSSMKMNKREMTERIIRAIKNPYINVISHPFGRLLKMRDEYQIDFDKILRVAKEFKTILEINSQPIRLDLSDRNVRRTKEAGVKMIINTDSHRKEHMCLMGFGIAQARRGWAEKKDIINTQPLTKLLKCF